VLGFDPWSELPIRMLVEFGVKEKISVVGHVDHFYPEEKAIWELKSSRFVKWQDQKGMLPRKRDTFQTQGYYSIWTKCYSFPCEMLLLTYFDDEAPPRTFEIERCDLTESLRTRAIALHRAILVDAEPEAEPNPLCRFCPFKARCNGD
jgi:CRISPR/Cas system-associated exonuclease Cas4 (RecB family)